MSNINRVLCFGIRLFLHFAKIIDVLYNIMLQAGYRFPNADTRSAKYFEWRCTRGQWWDDRTRSLKLIPMRQVIEKKTKGMCE